MNGQLNFAIWVIVIGGALTLALHLWVFEIWTVPSDDPLLTASTAPLLRGGDVLIVGRQSGAERGQLVRCQDPEAPGRFVVGRAMARSGETVEIHQEVVSVDHRRTPSPRGCDRVKAFDPKRNEEVELDCSIEEYAGREFEILSSRAFPEPQTTTTVELGKWFLVSDDRHVHLDSRDFGPVAASTCQHIMLRLVGPAGLGDSDTRFTFIW